MIVVIPSCRSINIENVAPLIDFGARFVVIDDSYGSIRVDHPQFTVYNWHDYPRLLGPNAGAIPKRNGTCRSLGFFIAWKESDPNETIVALDDDCVIDASDLGEQVLQRLSPGLRYVASGRGLHMNTFDLLCGMAGARLFPRGFPYSHRISYAPWTFKDKVSGECFFNLGLWRGTLDINAIDRIQMEGNYFPDITLSHECVAIPPGKLVSVCAGNMHFRRELIPAIYQLPMNIEIMPKGTINRHGDIWAGFILKKLMDIRGDLMTVGGPIVTHNHEGPFVHNAASEHLAGLVNEEFIDVVRRCTEDIQPGDYLSMMRHFHDNLRRYGSQTSPILSSYFDHLDRSLHAWLQAFGESGMESAVRREGPRGTGL